MKKEEVKISEEDITKIERAYYEYSAARDTVAYLLESHANETNFTNSEWFINYKNEQIKALEAYDFAKNELAIKYLPEKFVGDGKFRWEVDFTKKVMNIYEA